MKSTGKEEKTLKKNSSNYEKLLEEQKKHFSIQRFKGLGEMNPEELWETTLNPENRTFERPVYKGTKENPKRSRYYSYFNG